MRATSKRGITCSVLGERRVGRNLRRSGSRARCASLWNVAAARRRLVVRLEGDRVGLVGHRDLVRRTASSFAVAPARQRRLRRPRCRRGRTSNSEPMKPREAALEALEVAVDDDLLVAHDALAPSTLRAQVRRPRPTVDARVLRLERRLRQLVGVGEVLELRRRELLERVARLRQAAAGDVERKPVDVAGLAGCRPCRA